MRRIATSLLISALAAAGLSAQAIQYVESRKIWLLTTRDNSYAMGVGPNGTLQNLYWGAPLWRADDLPAPTMRREFSSFDPPNMETRDEFPAWGGTRYYEPALKLTREDGDRDVVLSYVSHLIHENTLDITLKDVRDDVQVVLHYRVFPDNGVLERSATILNKTAKPLMLESAQSATWNLPVGVGAQLTYLSGRWASETQINREAIHQGMKVLESRKGVTGQDINPWFAIDAGDASEESGGVWFGALAWSGNWRITVEQTPAEQVRVTGGLNTFDFDYPLKAGESLDTPALYGGYSAKGFGEASRLMHRFEREQITPGGLSSRLRPVLYNSWEATQFKVTEAGQKELATAAAKMGVELFVMDDGWHGNRNNERSGLGDWNVNLQKFPSGLKGLIDHVNGLDMDFGLWIEPESVNADSDLYRKHPDWVIGFPGRPHSELRTQMVLNLARSDVKEFVFDTLDKLATENNIKYFKWDMNRPLSEPGWDEQPVADQRKLWVEYVRNLYEIMDRLRAKHPKLEIEDCASGGGRLDLGMLSRTDEVWTSDNTEAYDRLRIQEGFTLAYAPKFMSAWVTDVPNGLANKRTTPLQYRFLVAMQGALGIGANLMKWSDAESAEAAKLVALYKRIRPTVQLGDLYRLNSPRAGDIAANQYVAADGKQSVLFVFRRAQEYRAPAPPVRLKGLDEHALYRLESIDGKLVEKQPQMSGAYLMQAGLNLNLRNDFDSTAVILEKAAP